MLTPDHQRFRQAHHSAAVRMARFDRLSPEARTIINYAIADINLPHKPVTAAMLLRRRGAKQWRPT